MTGPVRIHILAKAPLAGFANTRLAPLLGEKNAAWLARQQLRRTVARAREAALGPVTLWLTPGCWHPATRALAESAGVRLRPQAPGDLGARMFHALRSSWRREELPLLIGTDCAGLEAGDLLEAAEVLRARDCVVIGPAHDGGYYLLGTRRRRPDLFRNMPWGGDTVFARTLGRLRQSGVPLHLLRARRDLDRVTDFRGESAHGRIRRQAADAL